MSEPRAGGALFSPRVRPAQRRVDPFSGGALRLAGRENWVYNGDTTKEVAPMAKNNSTSLNKESRLSIRVDPERKAVIARAAKQLGHTISDFVMENAYQ